MTNVIPICTVCIVICTLALVGCRSTKKHDCEAELSKLLPPGYRLVVNQEHVKVMYADCNKNEPYRSWTIFYSTGMVAEPDGGWKSLYHEPKMRSLDMRKMDLK